MNKQTTSSSFSQSIIASDSFLEDVARRCIERELLTRQADMLNAFDDTISNYWNISDRH